LCNKKPYYTLVNSGLEDFMKAIKHDKAVAVIIGSIVLATAGLVVSGLNKSERKAVEANVESFDVVDSEGMNNLLSLEGMDSLMVGATLDDFYGSMEITTEEESQTEEVTGETVAEETVTEEESTEPESEQETVPESPYDGSFLVNVDEYLNVRAEGSEDAEIVGKIYAGGGGQVLEQGAEWSKVQSGSVTGYISNAYAWFGKDMENSIPYVCPLIATSTVDNLRMRTGPGTDYSIEDVVDAGTQMVVMAEDGDWLAVSYDGQTLYTAKEYVSVEYQIGTGITIEEEQAAIAAEQARIAEEAAAEAARQAEEEAKLQQQIANAQISETVYSSAYNLSAEDTYLLACLVTAEAGGECYEGKLAVANIVLNRLGSGNYGNTISDVIYASGQFSVVRNGALDRAINNGPNDGSVQAAADALAGTNNVSGYTSFCTLAVANYSRYSAYSIIGNQVFYR
jgi:spore germination cell wall hydrolase CwlJ-like protein